MHIRILPTFLLSLTILVSCGTHKTYNRVYLLSPMPNVESPFTNNCPIIGMAKGKQPFEYLDAKSASNSFLSDVGMKEITITTTCLNDKKEEMGRTVFKTTALKLHIGSGEGSSYKEEFAKKATTSGDFFPLIQEINN